MLLWDSVYSEMGFVRAASTVANVQVRDESDNGDKKRNRDKKRAAILVFLLERHHGILKRI